MTDGAPFRVDLHVKVLDDTVVERARRAGLDAIVYAPHFTRIPDIRARAEAFSSDDLRVIPAREVFTGTWRNRKHVLAVGLSEPVPDFIMLEAAMAEFDRQGAAVLVPHPEFATVSLAEADLCEYRSAIHAVEIFNPKHLPRHNRRARELAETCSLPAFASSYAHLRSTVGVAHTALDATISSEADLVDVLHDGIQGEIVHAYGFDRWEATLGELGHLAYENSWQKFERVFLEGTEATHPHHIAYNGRFDDASVY